MDAIDLSAFQIYFPLTVVGGHVPAAQSSEGRPMDRRVGAALDSRHRRIRAVRGSPGAPPPVSQTLNAGRPNIDSLDTGRFGGGPNRAVG